MRIINFRRDLFAALTCVICMLVLCTLLMLSMQGLESQLPLTTKIARVPSSYPNASIDFTSSLKFLSHSPGDKKTPAWLQILKLTYVKPGFRYSRGRNNVQYVLGLPTVHRREEKYLEATVSSLIKNMNSQQQDNCLIVILIGETSVDLLEAFWLEFSEKFGKHLVDGLIDVISPRADYYPDFDSLDITLHDTPERVRWRTKQNLDYVSLMSYARRRGTYYLQLEDNVKPREGFFDYIIKFEAMHSRFRMPHHRPWIVLSFSDLGIIGKLLHTSEIKHFLSHVHNFYNNQPIDWLLQSYVKLRVCRWDSLETEGCENDYALYFIRSSESQFQRIGKKSPLHDKEQRLEDLNFGRQSSRLRLSHLEKTFNLINTHKKTTLSDHLKKGESYSWLYMPRVSSLLRFLINHQYFHGQIRIRSGAQSRPSFTELILDVLHEEVVLEMNGTEADNCGFLVSYIHDIDIYQPYFLFFYIREAFSGNNETLWFRRFSWSPAPDMRVSAKLCALFWVIMHKVL